MADEYAVKVTVRNGLILRQMKKLGIKTQTELAKQSGLDPGVVGTLIGLKKRPVSAYTGEWLDCAFALSAALHMEPEELWTEKQRGMALDRNSREISMSEDAVAQLASGQGTEQMVQKILTSEVVNKALQVLSPRYEAVIRRKFFEGDTSEDIAKEWGISRARVNQMEAKALQKLKHPSRSKLLKDIDVEGASYGAFEHNPYTG
jgi:DNA-binding CsgD family transcriptional regulator